jgi:hypothetical protein
MKAGVDVRSYCTKCGVGIFIRQLLEPDDPGIG